MMNAMTMSTATSDVDHERQREAGDAGLAWSVIPAGASLEKERSGEDEAPPGSEDEFLLIVNAQSNPHQQLNQISLGGLWVDTGLGPGFGFVKSWVPLQGRIVEGRPLVTVIS